MQSTAHGCALFIVYMVFVNHKRIEPSRYKGYDTLFKKLTLKIEDNVKFFKLISLLRRGGIAEVVPDAFV